MLNTISSIAERARAPEGVLDEHTLLRTLHGGLRADVWLGLVAGAALLDTPPLERVVLVKVFFPHVPGPALEGLWQELELAKRLEHENITRHWFIAAEPERPFIISEYLEGTTLRTLLLRASAAGIPLAQASVARVLSGIIEAVLHAESRAGSIPERVLVHQRIAADDVFITFDGSVKLLGFKSQLRATGGDAPEASTEPRGVTATAAIDALLAGHFSTGLRSVLGAANDTGVRRVDRLWQVHQTLQRWQTDELGSDGRSELAAVMQSLFSAARLERTAQLLSALGETPQVDDTPLDDAPPVSEIRAVRSRAASTPARQQQRAVASDE